MLCATILYMNDSATYATPPHANPAPAAVTPLVESEARTWAMLVHLIAVLGQLVSGGLLGFIAPLVIWLLYRQRSALVDFHGRQNLNLQLTLLVVGIAAFAVGALTWGVGLLITLPLWGAYWIYALVVSIIAGIKAQSGEYYRIRFNIPFIR